LLAFLASLKQNTFAEYKDLWCRSLAKAASISTWCGGIAGVIEDIERFAGIGWDWELARAQRI